jgi:hypothetical protein
MKTITLLLLASCATSSEPTAPTLVFDFSARPLAGAPAPLPGPGATPKALIRGFIDQARPQLATCIANGTLELAFTLALDSDGVSVESVDIANPCAREVLLAMDTSWMKPAASRERWTVHVPLYTGTR